MSQEETNVAFEAEQEVSEQDTSTHQEITEQSEVERLQRELALSEDRLKRQMAEFQNYRRRSEQEKNTMLAFGKATVVQQLLDVLDDLRRSLDSASGAEDKDEAELKAAYTSLNDGVTLVYQKFLDELVRLDVHPIEAIGQPFDEQQHEALMQQPAPEGIQAGEVMGEIQKGYRMGDRVIRHSKVVVAA